MASQVPSTVRRQDLSLTFTQVDFSGLKANRLHRQRVYFLAFLLGFLAATLATAAFFGAAFLGEAFFAVTLLVVVALAAAGLDFFLAAALFDLAEPATLDVFGLPKADSQPEAYLELEPTRVIVMVAPSQKDTRFS